MLDEEVCASMKEARTPLISLAALRGLRRLLDSQSPSAHTPCNGQSHACKGGLIDEGSAEATTPATGENRTMGTVANGGTKAMPEDSCSALASNCDGGENEGETVQ
jgi:acyl-coenzyme A thioesterase PaaI-like protein